MEQQLSGLGIDIAKQVVHLVGMDAHGTLLVRTRLFRAQVMACIAQWPPTLSGMDACGGAHDWARRSREHGHEVKWMAPPCVQPHGQAHTKDLREAEAIAEAVTRPTPRFVAAKSVGQRALQALQRVRERLMQARTARIKEARGLLYAYGSIVPHGAATFRTHVPEQVATEAAQLTPHRLGLSRQLLEEWDALEARVATYAAPLAQVAPTPPVCQRLVTMPGGASRRPRRWWPPWLRRRRATMGASAPRGWGWGHGTRAPAASRAWWASANLGSAISAPCWGRGPGGVGAGEAGSTTGAANGAARGWRVGDGTGRLWPWPTNRRGSPGC